MGGKEKVNDQTGIKVSAPEDKTCCLESEKLSIYKQRKC
jgi:hypothetical protein